MSRFPLLKTGAVLQYPSRREVRRPTGVLRFVDGSEQRFAETGSAERRWVVRLDLLDDAELQAIEELFEAVQGRSGRFLFEDPYDGAEYPDCSFDQDELVLQQVDEDRGQITMTIKENKGAS